MQSCRCAVHHVPCWQPSLCLSIYAAPAKTAAVAAKPAAAAPSKGSRRMLLQVLLPDGPAANATSVDGLAVMKYTIAAADAGRARRRLMSAVQEDGQAFYDALSKAGVPYKPSVTVSGEDDGLAWAAGFCMSLYIPIRYYGQNTVFL